VYEGRADGMDPIKARYASAWRLKRVSQAARPGCLRPISRWDRLRSFNFCMGCSIGFKSAPMNAMILAAAP
jgi:hypothetical protein